MNTEMLLSSIDLNFEGFDRIMILMITYADWCNEDTSDL